MVKNNNDEELVSDMDLSVIFAFWCVSILFVLTPGADWAYAILAGIRGSLLLQLFQGLYWGIF